MSVRLYHDPTKLLLGPLNFEHMDTTDLVELIVKERFEIKGRGPVYTLSLKENSISNDRKELRTWLNREVRIEGVVCTVKGIESWGDTDGVRDMVGFLVHPKIKV